MLSRFAIGAFAVALAACGNNASDTEDPASSSSTQDPSSSSVGFADAATVAARLGLGVNLGNHFESPGWGEWGQDLEAGTFTKVAALGFKHVRIPVRWDAYAATEAPYTIDADRLDSMVAVVHAARDAGLMVIINQHHHEPIYIDPVAETPRLLAIWRQIAERFSGEGDYLLFELLNEPRDALDQDAWMVLYPQMIAAIRESNPERTLVLGGVSWNSVAGMKQLVLPEDKSHLVATFHYYDPYQFTHQGASWADGSDAWLGKTWTGMEDEQTAIRTALTEAQAFGSDNGIPVYMGEFGAYSMADTASRALWTEFVYATAKELGMSGAYWEWSDSFGIYDKSTGTVREFLRKALLAPSIDWSNWPIRPDLTAMSSVLFDDFENTRNDSALTTNVGALAGLANLNHPDSTSSVWYLYRIATSNWSLATEDTLHNYQEIKDGAKNNMFSMFSAEGYQGKGIHGNLHLLGDNYPWAGFGANLHPSCRTASCTVDLSALQAISFWAKGSGEFRVKIGTKAAADPELEDNWGNYETTLSLSAEWKQYVIWVDMLKPSPYSALESSTHTWAEASKESSSLEFMGPQLSGPEADEKSEIFVDNVVFHGVNAGTFGLQ